MLDPTLKKGRTSLRGTSCSSSSTVIISASATEDTQTKHVVEASGNHQRLLKQQVAWHDYGLPRNFIKGTRRHP